MTWRGRGLVPSLSGLAPVGGGACKSPWLQAMGSDRAGLIKVPIGPGPYRARPWTPDPPGISPQALPHLWGSGVAPLGWLAGRAWGENKSLRVLLDPNPWGVRKGGCYELPPGAPPLLS